MDPQLSPILPSQSPVPIGKTRDEIKQINNKNSDSVPRKANLHEGCDIGGEQQMHMTTCEYQGYPHGEAGSPDEREKPWMLSVGIDSTPGPMKPRDQQ
jgi:hypothetical protein